VTIQLAIRVTALDVRYAQDAPLALRQVRLQVDPGERCVLVGENGAGKTTLRGAP